MAELRVRRDRDSAGFLRRILVELDGADWCGLRPGEEQTLAVAAGRHVLRARMDWITSKALVVEIDSNEVTELQTSMPWRAAVDMIFKPGSASRMVVCSRTRTGAAEHPLVPAVSTGHRNTS